ncbi:MULTISPECIES: M28 family peptidase [Limnospira]|uniref:Peptidase M28 n=5 Tax=Limnospira TaxID=2596745 RepID=B5W7S1_LIMMA|nr:MULTISPECIES: M28 family peptidase [Limnospira]MDC0836257.1 M28 family peptidase [Limnoraphis robusta]MDT9190793.1 M28 family peptidase [Limnospira sp. PMC 894.15]UWU45381.1 Peptidase family M28 [Arthrospira platensis C1]EDZ92450.1 peptidase M28 [Limnospira maxima CS-328]MDT9236716.1 M28 family peptidase [Limnospira sp. PMC 917.15]
MILMPGKSYRGTLPPLTRHQEELSDRLRQDVEAIAGTGEHNYIYYDNLLKTEAYLESRLTQAGYTVQRQEYLIGDRQFTNLEVEIPGEALGEEIIVIGAHYDSVVGSPGANDNGSGAAAVLALADYFAATHPQKTLRFVEFVNEEPPFSWTPDMGSWVYAKRSRERNEKIVAMLSLETMGYYSDTPGSQTYPLGLLNNIYPITGNFIAFVGNFASGGLVRQVVKAFRTHTLFPSEGSILPNTVPGAGWSDHWSFWQEGYPGIMVTDTAMFRYPYYHTQEDTPAMVNYNHLARVVSGLEAVIMNLANID